MNNSVELTPTVNEASIIEINGTCYPLASNLMVAYKVQGQHNHKSYMEIFQNMDTLTLEQQIGIVYAAFQVANPTEAKMITQQVMFNSIVNDSSFNVKKLLDKIKFILSGILGKNLDEAADDATDDVGNE